MTTGKVHYSHWIPKLLNVVVSCRGITFGEHIFIRFHKHETDPWLLRHERIHMMQYKRLGTCRFLGWWVFSENRRKQLEAEADGHEHEPGYLGLP